MAKTKKTGKGVGGLFVGTVPDVPAFPKETKSERDARRKREKRAKLREAAKLIASEIAKPPSERVKFDPKAKPSGSFAGTISAEAAEMAGLSPRPPLKMRVNLPTGSLDFTEDKPAPVRLTLAALAQAFDEACVGVEDAHRLLFDAKAKQDKAKTALDQALARRANGERA